MFCQCAMGQKVGVVLSGGGAKGLAHVGVLKALEESEIPVNYLVGTSIGGIIGGCYAAGMSPEQIEQMVLSEEFHRWINGLPETGYNYYYHRPQETPQFLKVNLALDSTFNFQLNSSIANDVSLNFALTEKTAQATAIANSNFDSLFVPLRVVTADIFTQREVVLDSGSLGNALRATQTVPFFYNPVKVDGKYLFDGGVYNNFPIDVMNRDFNPDVIIGVNVSSKVFDEYPYDRDDKLISQSLLYLLLDKSDPSEIPPTGVYIQPNLRGFSAFDFSRVKALIDSGYAQTMRQLKEIKMKVGRTDSCDEVVSRRNAFNSRAVPFVFNEITFDQFNSRQRAYIRRVFGSKRKTDQFYMSDIKRGYFQLVSEEYFSTVYPTIHYNRQASAFSLNLTERPQQNFQVGFGGVIATRDISNVFLGFNYYHFDRILTHASAGFQTGNFYKSALLKFRMDFPHQFFLEPYAAFDAWDYLNNNDLLKEVSTPTTPTVLRRFNRRYGLQVGVPFKHSFRGTLTFEGLNTYDRYINGDVFVSTDTLDELRLKGFKTGLGISTSSLNRKQYATAGRAFSLTLNYFLVEEDYTPGSSSTQTNETLTHHHWLRLRLAGEQYFGSGWFRSGYSGEIVYSNQQFFENYFGTIINAPGFFPLQDSRTLILQNFRAFNFAGAGIRNVFTIHKHFDFRLEAYGFKPFDYIVENSDQDASFSSDDSAVFFAGTAGLVYHSPIGPVSLSANYYDDDENQLGVLLHVGFLLFNKHSFE
jgi:NTE family protein